MIVVIAILAVFGAYKLIKPLICNPLTQDVIAHPKEYRDTVKDVALNFRKDYEAARKARLRKVKRCSH